MKYLVDKICVNSDQIVCAEYAPAHPDKLVEGKVHPSKCVITLTSIHPEGMMGDSSCSESDIVDLRGDEADRFWDYYIRDALTVVSP